MNFDENQWYHIYNGDKGNSLVGTILFANSSFGERTTGSVFKSTNQDVRSQKWQIVSMDSEYYVFRTQDSSTNGYMATYFAPDRTNLTGSTLGRMIRNNVSDDSVYWKVSPWGDGTYFLTNKANGTDWHLGYGGETDSDGGTESQMQSNISTIQPRQRFQFEPIAEINDEKFSRSGISVGVVNKESLPSSTQSSTQSGSPTTSGASNPSGTPGTPQPSSSETSASSGGLSTGAKAGIGAAVGGVALIALVVLGLFLFRRRKRRVASTTESTTPYAQAYSDEVGEGTATKYGHVGVAEKAELSGNSNRHELPSVNPKPAELPGGEAPRQELPGEHSNR
ncbi:hypothetical protein N0V90_006121 [Kalmusia sp. IMI 367209]|nr:hypothetical protein N0V90_006121 [Kalmusia sp. IMI 367209]